MEAALQSRFFFKAKVVLDDLTYHHYKIDCSQVTNDVQFIQGMHITKCYLDKPPLRVYRSIVCP